jgi:trigger factor
MEARLNVEVVEKEGLKRELKIQVPADVVDQAYEKVYDQFRQKAQIKGFRPGKAPVSMIKNRFKQEAREEVIEGLVSEYFGKALQEQNLDPVGKPVVSTIDVDEGKPLTFTVGIEVMPQIETVKHEKLVVQKPEIDVPDDEVDKVVEQLRKAHADVRSIDRAVGPGDVLICDLEVEQGEVGDLPAQMQNQEIDLGNEFTVQAFRDQLTGAKRDDTRSVKVEYPPEYEDKRFAGKTVVYKTMVKEVKERVLPLVDDNFAKLVGEGQTLLELRLAIRRRIEADLRADAARASRKMIVDQVVRQNEVPVPESMVDHYLDGVVEDFRRNTAEFDEKELRERYRPVGVHAVRWYLLYHRLGELEKIEVSQDDTENWIKRFADSYRMDVPKAKALLAKADKGEDIKDGILEEKVMDFLLSKAQMQPIEKEPKEGTA